jgi:hypothetical protein
MISKKQYFELCKKIEEVQLKAVEELFYQTLDEYELKTISTIMDGLIENIQEYNNLLELIARKEGKKQ